jgi:hypothetical protein
VPMPTQLIRTIPIAHNPTRFMTAPLVGYEQRRPA